MCTACRQLLHVGVFTTCNEIPTRSKIPDSAGSKDTDLHESARCRTVLTAGHSTNVKMTKPPHIHNSSHPTFSLTSLSWIIEGTIV